MRCLLITILLLPFFSKAQVLQGTITDVATGAPMYMVSIINRNTGEVATSAANGLYTIHANTGETIAYSYVGYATEVRIQQPHVMVATINVALSRDENELHTVIIKSGKLTKYQRDSIERAEIYKLPLQRTHPSPIMSPFSALAELFSQKARRTYAFQKTFAAGEQEKFIDTRYTPKLVASLTGATGDTIGHFMYACPMPYDFARTCSDLELKMWIRSSYRNWLASNDSTK